MLLCMPSYIQRRRRTKAPQAIMHSLAYLHQDGILGFSQAVEHKGISHLQVKPALKILPSSNGMCCCC